MHHSGSIMWHLADPSFTLNQYLSYSTTTASLYNYDAHTLVGGPSIPSNLGKVFNVALTSWVELIFGNFLGWDKKSCISSQKEHPNTQR